MENSATDIVLPSLGEIRKLNQYNNNNRIIIIIIIIIMIIIVNKTNGDQKVSAYKH